jgi:large subunit ribosomal protein L28
MIRPQIMAKQCQITGKKTQIGGRYSNRTRATQFNPCGKARRQPNLQKKRIYVPELGKHVTVNISTKALRTIAKNGAYETLKGAGLI